MRCKKEEFIEGATFHIYNRSLEESKLFKEHDDYSYYLDALNHHINDNSIEILAYCLKPDSFDCIIRQITEYAVYQIFNKVNTSYAMYFNSKYKRRGKLFTGKLQHKLVGSDQELISLCKYIHFIPVKFGLVSKLSDWPYSNYHEYAKLRFGFLYSEALILEYPKVFANYRQSLIKYEKRLDQKFLLYK